MFKHVAKIRFSNGKTMNVNLGEIYIDDTIETNEDLKNIGTSVSSDFSENGELLVAVMFMKCKSQLLEG